MDEEFPAVSGATELKEKVMKKFGASLAGKGTRKTPQKAQKAKKQRSARK
jgi:hypothetical protein